MKLAAVMKSCEVYPRADGTMEVRPEWATAPSVLVRMAVAAEIERVLQAKLPKKGRRK